MARVALPQSKIRQRRKQRRIRITIALSVALLVLFGLIVGASWIPNIRISKIEVEGIHVASAKEVTTFVENELKGTTLLVFPKNSVFLYPKDALVEKLQTTFPALHSVRIRAKVPTSFQTVVVSVAERQPKALWCGAEAEEACAYIDQGGIVYARAPEFSDAVYIRYFGEAETLEEGEYPKQFLTPEQFTSLAALVEALKNEVGPVNYVEVSEEGDAKLLFMNGFYILFAVEDEGGDVFERFTLARDAEPFKGRSLGEFEYLDLRFGDKLYYKLKTE